MFLIIGRPIPILSLREPVDGGCYRPPLVTLRASYAWMVHKGSSFYSPFYSESEVVYLTKLLPRVFSPAFLFTSFISEVYCINVRLLGPANLRP